MCACVHVCVSNESNKFHPQASSAFSCGVSLPLSSRVYQITEIYLLLYSKGWRFPSQKILFLRIKSTLCHTVYWSFCSWEHYTLSLLGMDIGDYLALPLSDKRVVGWGPTDINKGSVAYRQPQLKHNKHRNNSLLCSGVKRHTAALSSNGV